MSKGGGGTSTNTIQKADPWSGAQPYLTGGLSNLAQWYNSGAGSQYYPGSTVAPFHPLTEQGLGMTATRALDGSPVTTNADSFAANTLNGNYLDPSSNPWLASTFKMGAQQVQSAMDSQFNKGNTLGSSLEQGATAANLNDLATQIYGGNYNNAAQRQVQVAALSPQIAQQDYFDPSQLVNVGGAYQNQAQNYLTAAQNAYNYNQQAPYQRLAQYFGIVNPAAGQGSATSGTTTQTGSGNTLSQILGGALGATGLASQLGLFGSAAAAGTSVPLEVMEALTPFGL